MYTLTETETCEGLWTSAPDVITTTRKAGERYVMLVGHWELDLEVSGSLDFLICLTVK